MIGDLNQVGFAGFGIPDHDTSVVQPFDESLQIGTDGHRGIAAGRIRQEELQRPDPSYRVVKDDAIRRADRGKGAPIL